MKLKRTIMAVGLTGFLLSSTGCGVLLYPERQGQSGGKIDPVVAILDGLGLFLYVIPGLVAFIIDFHQGTIYLPGGYSANGEPRTIPVAGEMTEENIERALAEALGAEVNISAPNVQAHRIDYKQMQLMESYAWLRGHTVL